MALDFLNMFNWGMSTGGNSSNIVRPGGPVAGSISQTRGVQAPNYGQTVPMPAVQGTQTTYQPPMSIPRASYPTTDSGNLPPDGGGGGGGGGGGISQPSGPSPDDQMRNEYFSYLDNQLGQLPGVQSGMEQQVSNLEGSQRGSIESGLGTATSGLEQSKTNIKSNQAESLRDIETNMRNSMRAGDIFLGARGAGDSSAVNMLSYALSKATGQNRTAILKQGQQLLTGVDQKINEAKTIAQDQLQQLNTWKNNKLIEISQYIQGLRGQIDAQKANYIQGQLSDLDSQVNTYKQAVAQWIIDRGTNLSQVQSQLQSVLGGGQQIGNTAFARPTTPTLAMNTTSPESSYTGYNPLKKSQYPANTLTG